MNRKLYALGALVAGSGLVVACSSSNVPAGQDNLSNSDLNQIDAGTGLCGSAACAPGQLCCAGPDEYCTPTCESVSSCPVLGRPCKVADAGTGAETGEGCACPNQETSCNITVNGEQCLCTNGAVVCEGADSGGGTLQWYTTCGAPVCENVPDGGFVDAGQGCPPIGSSCTTKGQTCGTPSASNCDTTLVCDNVDPKAGSCPISSSKYKDGIQYVSDGQLEQLHDETMRMKLATYNYKSTVADPHPLHLGFIIEDNPTSLAVDQDHTRVDMYGYISMVVASMQVQEKEIAELKKELAAARRQGAPRK